MITNSSDNLFFKAIERYAIAGHRSAEECFSPLEHPHLVIYGNGGIPLHYGSSFNFQF